MSRAATALPPAPAQSSPPGVALWVLGSFLLVVLAAVLLARLTGVGATRTEAPAPAWVLAYTFHDRSDGGIDVRRASDGGHAHTVAPQSNGFLRGTLRGLARERRLRGIGPGQPVQLAGLADGRLLLIDPATEWRVDLSAFGPTNAAAFAPLAPQR
jgi:putative photosynthetic complex assembly protein